jgi:GT2 family glycosyltransferase
MTDIVDTMGLELLKSRNVIDKFSGEKYEGPLDAQEVFGVSGALMCLRASALESVRWNKEYFDEDFFAYKEDVDLSWRLRNMDWRIIIVPQAAAYHLRSARGDINLSFWKKILSQRKKSEKIKFWSARNHLWAIVKNDFCINHLLDWPFIFFSEFGKFIYYLVLDTKTVRAYFSAFYGLPKMLAKRAYLKNAKIRPEEIRQWIK